MEKIKQAIQAEIDKIENDERYHYPLATIEVNAPLALIQCSMGAKMQVLKKLQEVANGEG